MQLICHEAIQYRRILIQFLFSLQKLTTLLNAFDCRCQLVEVDSNCLLVEIIDWLYSDLYVIFCEGVATWLLSCWEWGSRVLICFHHSVNRVLIFTLVRLLLWYNHIKALGPVDRAIDSWDCIIRSNFVLLECLSFLSLSLQFPLLFGWA